FGRLIALDTRAHEDKPRDSEPWNLHRSHALLLIRSLTGTLHRDFRGGKSQRFVERRHPVSRRPKHPRDFGVVAHGSTYQRAPDALATVLLRHDEHGDVAVRHSVGQRT